VAVLVVVLFHCGFTFFAGGFVGVDVFFVLSGFLITGLLVDEGGRARINLTAFYSRRARRLLPAALIVIVATSVLWLLTASVIQREPVVADARAASLYFANWHFAVTATDYFALSNEPSPFLHFWSLAVEEQFYLMWPAMVTGAFALARWRRSAGDVMVRNVAIVLGAASAISLVLTTRAGSASFAYFATNNRIYQLLAGAALAVIVRRASRVAAAPLVLAAQVAGIGAILAVSFSWWQVGPGARGAAAAAGTLALLWSFEEGAHLPVARGLSWAPFPFVGRISYGIYLWHWPVALLLQKFTSTNPWVVFPVCSAISIALAWLSNHYIEQPVRVSKALAARGRGVFVAGLALSALVGLVVAPMVLKAERRPMFVAPVTDLAPGDGGTGAIPEVTLAPGQTTIPDANADAPVPPLSVIQSVTRNGPKGSCLPAKVPDVCVNHKGASGTLLVIGDSHLFGFGSAFAELGAKYDYTVVTWLHVLCPWQKDVLPGGPTSKGCATHQAHLYDEVLPQLKPDAVVAVSRAYDDPAQPNPLHTPDDPTLRDPGTVLSEHMQSAVDAVLKDAAKLVVLEPWPSTSFDQRDCLASATLVSECAATVQPDLPSDAALKAVMAKEPRVALVSLNDQICPRLPVCDAVVNDLPVRWDKNHLTYQFNQTLVPDLERQLIALGTFG
jgi:peptidoglycan/LPS O-acetylase OafA/YrhL